MARRARSVRWRITLAERVVRGMEAFQARFWNPDRECLYDVVDVDHRAGAVDGSLRPNQIFAAGGLPYLVLGEERARRVVACLEGQLVTPAGVRSLAPGEPGYSGRYEGGPEARDLAYHQGTAWPWLMGPFVEAWVRVRGRTIAARTRPGEVSSLSSNADLSDWGTSRRSRTATRLMSRADAFPGVVGGGADPPGSDRSRARPRRPSQCSRRVRMFLTCSQKSTSKNGANSCLPPEQAA